ncbi:putative quinol monooxygenase [Myxococcus stipitatus]|uniref:putative quinol monooxygenase n=1 Tax=Myxococcus stipitatus TaxID=83455 RepID=UPI0030CEC1F2
MTLLVQLEFKLKQPIHEPEFLRIARALASASATEPGTLRYQWFVNHKPGHYTILEEYTDADAAETHNGNVGALLAQLFSVVELVSVSFYGELNKYVSDWATGRDGVSTNLPLASSNQGG